LRLPHLPYKVQRGKYQRDFFHKKYQKGFFLAFHSNCFVFLTAITSGRAGASRSALPGGTLRIRLGLTGRGSRARQGLLPSPFALEDKGVMQIATAVASKKIPFCTFLSVLFMKKKGKLTFCEKSQ